MNKEKKKALLIVGGTGIALIVFLILLPFLIIAFFPILIAVVLLMIGMAFKWGIEWCIKNIHIFGLKEKSEKVKEKIDEGIGIVKENYEILKKKNN